MQLKAKTKRIGYLHLEKTIHILWTCHEKGTLENVITMGRLEGKRSRGRPRETILNSLASCHRGTMGRLEWKGSRGRPRESTLNSLAL